MNKNRKNTAIIGILLCCIYYFVVISFVTTTSQNWLATFDIVTMFSGIYFIFLIMTLPFSNDKKNQNSKIAAIIFVSALMIFTNLVHTINLISIQNLKNGIDIPNYLQIGKPNSFLTAIEYLAWGIFLGLAFLFSFFGIKNENKTKSLKIILLICAILCFIGFFGWLIINENLWYMASMGYGIGTIIICIKLLIYKHNVQKN